MTDLQLYSEISSLPSDLKQEVSDFVAFLKQKSKRKEKSSNAVNNIKKPSVPYNSKFSDILLTGPVFSEAQVLKIEQTRKSINEWRTK